MCIRDREWNALLDWPVLTILAGDLNAKHPSRNTRIANAYINSLYRYVSDPTHFPFTGQRPHVLDSVIAKNLTHLIQVSSVLDLSSDHSPALYNCSRYVGFTPTSRSTC